MYTDFDAEDFKERPGSPTRLREPLNLKNLLAEGSAGFDVDLDYDLDDEDLEPEKVFRPEDLMKHINLDVLGGNNLNDDPDLSPFEKLRKKMVNVTNDGKVMKMMKKEGIGSICLPKAHVSIHYQAFTEFKEIPFDVSYLRSKEPETYKLGSGYLLRGLELAILTMKAGEKASFLIHYDYAYGALGCGLRIPPESTILFEIELVNFSENDDYLTKEEDEELLFEAVIKKADAHINKGNKRLNQDKNLQLAVSHYKTARNLVLDYGIHKDKDDALAKLLNRVFQNLAICFNLKKEYKMVCVAAMDASHVIPHLAEGNNKLQFAWGKALKNLGEYDAAKKKLQQVKKMQPQSKEVHEELQSLEKLWRDYNDALKLQSQKFFNLNSVKKVEETEKASDDFIETMTNKLNDYKLSDLKEPLNLHTSLTNNEKIACKSIVTSLNLKFSEHKEIDGTVRNIIIRK